VWRNDGTARILVEETYGTVAARGLFEMRNNGGSYFSMENTASGSTWWFVHENAPPNRFIITSNASPGPKFVLTNTGDLTVAGSVTTATQTIPDYVFEPDYKLMPLDELASFIKSEKHLPNVPANAEIQKAGGINISDMQIRLLEKVEELTLYTLQQEETLREAERMMRSQATTIGELTERLARIEELVARPGATSNQPQD
jgi:hypothetical protein